MSDGEYLTESERSMLVMLVLTTWAKADEHPPQWGVPFQAELRTLMRKLSGTDKRVFVERGVR